MKTPHSFEQAVISLQEFLVAQKKPPAIQWVFREDLLLHKRQVFLRWPLPQVNELLAAKQYEVGREKGLGLALEVFCFDGEHAFCYVLVPDDAYSAEALMLTDLKLAYPTGIRKVIKIKGRWLWFIVSFFLSRRSSFGWLDLVPLRKQSWQIISPLLREAQFGR